MRDRYNATDFSIYDNLSSDSIETLKAALEIEHGRQFTFDEAKEIGVSLLKLFEALATTDAVETKKEEPAQEETHESLATTQLSLIY